MSLVFLPCQPSDEAAGVSAYDEFSRLVQTKRTIKTRETLCRRFTHTINAKANAMGIKKYIAGILLVWKI